MGHVNIYQFCKLRSTILEKEAPGLILAWFQYNWVLHKKLVAVFSTSLVSVLTDDVDTMQATTLDTWYQLNTTH